MRVMGREERLSAQKLRGQLGHLYVLRWQLLDGVDRVTGMLGALGVEETRAELRDLREGLGGLRALVQGLIVRTGETLGVGGGDDGDGRMGDGGDGVGVCAGVDVFVADAEGALAGAAVRTARDPGGGLARARWPGSSPGGWFAASRGLAGAVEGWEQWWGCGWVWVGVGV